MVTRVFPLIIFMCFLAGCASIGTQFFNEELDLTSECLSYPIPSMYSGTVFDFSCFYHPSYSGTNNIEAACLLDLPLSLVTDTIMLPYTGYKQIKYGNISDACKNNAER